CSCASPWPARTSGPFTSHHSKKPRSPSTPYLITSAYPAPISRGGSVASVSRSASTRLGWWNAPTRFLPAAALIAVLPPTLESTCASSVVGSCTKPQPRLRIAAAKPVRSPITPPPSASTWSPRSTSSANSQSVSRSSTAQLLAPSPGSSTSQRGSNPAAVREASTVRRQCAATLTSVTTGTRGLRSSPPHCPATSASRPPPTRTS